MMGLAGFANVSGIFEWIADRTIKIAGSSRARLFALVYAAGMITTIFFSNDATIVVLTPAVAGALRRIDASPVPYVVACALIANAASFALPISNPSNLLVFAGRMPSLAAWIAQFALPSLAAIVVTYATLRWFYRRDLAGTTGGAARSDAHPPNALSIGVLVVSAAAIVTASALAGPLGLVTFACAAVAFAITLLRDRAHATSIARDISWRVILLTAGLFIIVTALDDAGGFAASRAALAWCAQLAAPWSPLATGALTAIASNVINNLPVGLNLGETLPHMHAMPATAAAALVGVNLGPNATPNGSLATILWLAILKREQIAMSWWTFAGIGTLTTIPALTAALLFVR